ncbi:hypothetical protein BDQ94DRAFT_185696 [Aspergillus welwitschiae]|uniref:F-box domain-containing protein n=1 Tax=Aspergillus welwitschiae TaxID=1341132 RepID=A0A3F3PJI7_9EURO|nr:hypothetical protein BDQ94DRAFT_185696 [Aspergillus welwitschiae]RDH26892.1 hypothetical protein BDQ94DRAFT_185696 [Aspergillus welwitschiae]
MNTLPPEILLDILNRLDLRSLLKVSLVSKALRAAIRPMLSFGFTGCLKEDIEPLKNFSDHLLLDPSLASQVRSVKIESIHYRLTEELHNILGPLLERCPNIHHLMVSGDQETAEFFRRLLKNKHHLRQLQSFTNDYQVAWEPAEPYLQTWSAIFGLQQLSFISLAGCSDRMYHTGVPEIPPELQVTGEISLRSIQIHWSYLGYTILARVIQSCKSLEIFDYQWPSGFLPGDSDPATIVDALSLHKDSLKVLVCDFQAREDPYHGEYDQFPKNRSLEEFSCLQRVSVTHDCLPLQPLLPPSLEALEIKLPHQPPHATLIQNLASASHSSLSKLHSLALKYYPSNNPEGISDGFHERVKVTTLGYDNLMWN